MEVGFLLVLSLLPSAEITRKFIPPDGAVSGDYLEKEKEEDGDDEKTNNVEQISESRFGPHLDLTTLTDSHSEEPPRDGMVEDLAKD